ncbi:hypothetical protein M0804_012446 [Polistes exclamans]|nr:hypothetical protein M0804_012446 [Polistes exclamans]
MHSDRPGPVQYYSTKKLNIDTNLSLSSNNDDAFRRCLEENLKEDEARILQYSGSLEKSRLKMKKILEADDDLADGEKEAKMKKTMLHVGSFRANCCSWPGVPPLYSFWLP